METWQLSAAEGQIIKTLRKLDSSHQSFKLIVYGYRTSTDKRIWDLEPIPKIRLQTKEPLSLAVDD